MGKSRKIVRSFAGKWQISCIEVCGEQGWIVVEECESDAMIWEFIPIGEAVFPDGKVINGILWQDKNDYDCSYLPESDTLVVDQSIFAEDGFLLQCIEDLYRVEYTGENSACLYAIRFSDFPVDEQIRMKVRKI